MKPFAPALRKFMVFVWTLAAGALAAESPVVHVHPDGDDARSGGEGDPVRTIGRALALVKPGGTVWVAGGVYRESIRIEKGGSADAPLRLLAAEKETVVVSGTEILEDWQAEPTGDSGDAIFRAPWPYRFNGWSPTGTHPADDFHLLIGRSEQVLYRGVPLRQVLAKRQLARGTFFADLDAKTLYAWAPDNADLVKSKGAVEAATRPVLLECRADHVVIRGIRFRHAANAAQQGAARFEGNHLLIEDCAFEATNACGATFMGQDITVSRCLFEGNGQLGFGASGAHRLRVLDSVCRDNNTKGFDRGWEAGGCKITLSRDVLIERGTFLRNRGNGIWFDIGNEDAVVRHCLIADNEDAGLFYEISYRLHAHDNVILGNGLADTPGAWGAQAGISLSSSPECRVERNLLVGNREGFSFREQERSTPRIGDAAEVPVTNRDASFRNNLLAWNRDAQTWGWFDKEIPLPDLRPVMRDNLYAARPGQGLFHWGVAWRNPRKFSTLADVLSGLGLEEGSAVAPVRFGDADRLDFRLPPDACPLARSAYPRGEVPGVRLGTLDP